MVFIAVIVGLIILAAIVAYVVSYNGISRLRKQTEEALATMESVRRTYESKQAEGMTEEEKKKEDWYTLIQLLPSSYNQMRTCSMNYENLINMYFGRKSHKLMEWHSFCDWIESLPYASDLILGEKSAESE